MLSRRPAHDAAALQRTCLSRGLDRGAGQGGQPASRGGRKVSRGRRNRVSGRVLRLFAARRRPVRAIPAPRCTPPRAARQIPGIAARPAQRHGPQAARPRVREKAEIAPRACTPRCADVRGFSGTPGRARTAGRRERPAASRRRESRQAGTRSDATPRAPVAMQHRSNRACRIVKRCHAAAAGAGMRRNSCRYRPPLCGRESSAPRRETLRPSAGVRCG